MTPEHFRGKLSNDDLEAIFAGGRETTQTIAMVTSFLRDGLSMTIIAKIFGTSRQNVYGRVKRSLWLAERRGAKLEK